MQRSAHFPFLLRFTMVCLCMTVVVPAHSATPVQPHLDHYLAAQSVQRQHVLLGPQFVQGLSAEHMATSLRRRHLPSKVQLECAALDTKLPTLKRQVRRASPETKAMQRERLDQAKTRFAQLGC